MISVRSRILSLLAGATSALLCLSGSVQARLQTQPKADPTGTPASESVPITPVKATLGSNSLADGARAEDLAFARNLSRAFRSVASSAGPSVVHITQINPVVQRRSPFERGQIQMLPTGLGSGVIISSDGLILTNNHVIQVNNRPSEQLQVKLAGGREYSATLIGRDPSTDLAVIKIDATDLPYVELADSDQLEVGDWVVAIGSPFGLSNSVTAGIVSAKGRPLAGDGEGRIEDFIQTDAAINPGNSGGPLLNLNGQIVGINTAIASRTGGYEGIGFAVPSSLAKAVVDNITKNGRVVRGYLGVNFPINDEVSTDTPDGVRIVDVVADGPAAKAGLQPGDIIRTFQGRHLDTTRLRQSIAVTPPGTAVKLEVLRDDKPVELTVTLGDLSVANAATYGGVYAPDLGMTVNTITAKLARERGYTGPRTIFISNVEPGSLAEQTGLRPEDIITDLNGKRIESAEQFVKAITGKLEDGYELRGLRNGGRWSVEIKE